MSNVDRSAHTAALAPHPQRTRRTNPRARVSWSVWAQAGSQRMRLHTVDVSARGAKLRPRGAFRIGMAIELEFIKPDGRHLHVSGVVWRADPDGMAVLFLGTVPQGFATLAQRS